MLKTAHDAEEFIRTLGARISILAGRSSVLKVLQNR